MTAAALLLPLLTAVGSDAVTITKDGAPVLSICRGSLDEPVRDLHSTLERISGARLRIEEPERGKKGLYVGLAKDFPWIKADVTDLGAEGFLIRTERGSVTLIARESRGVSHAVTTFLHLLGCRWFFPGETWEIIPRLPTIAGSWDLRSTPAFRTQRRIWYGFGATRKGREDHAAWERRNRMGGPVAIRIGHTWHGLKPEKEFEAHPEWFAFTDGKRQPSKPCYSHPAVIKRAIESALRQAAQGAKVVSMTPPDGLGYCACKECLSVCGGAEPFEAHRSLFAKRPDGILVNVTSETLFRMVNRVAEAVAKKHPDTLIACYAYSAYSHPPSFTLHPNVYLQTTTAFRRTPISLEEQIRTFGKKLTQVGIREYYSSYKWDWDTPDPGRVAPARLREDLRFYRRNNVTAVNAEASNNWAARGLGYTVAARLMWNVDEDVPALLRDFYEKAFGPAARNMQRYFARWYGPEVAVLEDAGPVPERRKLFQKGRMEVEPFQAACRDLDAARKQATGRPDVLGRIDFFRMYLHYLALRHRLELAEREKRPGPILDAIRAETLFGGRLTDLGVVHGRPLVGKAFLHRFRNHRKLLETVPEAAKAGAGWRRVGKAPSPEELDRLWSEDREWLRW